MGRPTGSVIHKNLVATRYSKRLNKESMSDRIASFKQTLTSNRTKSRASVVENARHSRSGSRNISLNEEEDL